MQSDSDFCTEQLLCISALSKMRESVETSTVWYTNVNDIVRISSLRKGALQEVVFQSKTWDFSEPTGLLLTTVVFGTKQKQYVLLFAATPKHTQLLFLYVFIIHTLVYEWKFTHFNAFLHF